MVLEELTWHSPGRVWAVDHAKPPRPVDGIYPNGHNQPTALEVWQSRSVMDQAERERISLTVERIRSQMNQTMDPRSRESLPSWTSGIQRGTQHETITHHHRNAR